MDSCVYKKGRKNFWIDPASDRSLTDFVTGTLNMLYTRGTYCSALPHVLEALLPLISFDEDEMRWEKGKLERLIGSAFDYGCVQSIKLLAERFPEKTVEDRRVLMNRATYLASNSFVEASEYVCGLLSLDELRSAQGSTENTDAIDVFQRLISDREAQAINEALGIQADGLPVKKRKM